MQFPAFFKHDNLRYGAIVLCLSCHLIPVHIVLRAHNVTFLKKERRGRKRGHVPFTFIKVLSTPQCVVFLQEREE